MEVDIKAHVAKHPEDFNIKDAEQESKTFLSIIIDHYLIICGYAFASNWMEQYKNNTKKKGPEIQRGTKTSDTMLSSEDHD